MSSTTISIPIPTDEECLKPAEEPFRSIYAYSHFVTIPIYILSIYLLQKEMSNEILKSYRKYLIWHTGGNLIFEFYLTFFMVPVSYLPLKAMRTTGILKYYQISGISQVYALVILTYHTSFSVLELFQCRLRAISITPISNLSSLRKMRFAYYGTSCFTIILGSCLSPFVIESQVEMKRSLFLEIPSFPIVLLCTTGLVAPPIIDRFFTPSWLMVVASAFFNILVFIQTLKALTDQLEKVATHLSKNTLQLQRLLLTSLIIQAMVHGTMLGIPIIGFSYCMLFVVKTNSFGQVLILFASFHGFASTVTMIIFIKPLRIGLLGVVKKLSFCFWNKKSISVVSIEYIN